MNLLKPLIEELRGLRGLTQKDIAERAGLTQGYISMVANGTRGDTPDRRTRLALTRLVNEERARAGLKRRVEE